MSEPTCRRCEAVAVYARVLRGTGTMYGFCQACDPLADPLAAPFFEEITA